MGITQETIQVATMMERSQRGRSFATFAVPTSAVWFRASALVHVVT